MRFPAGTPIECRMRKWPDSPHWQWRAVYLGADHYGDWIGLPTGSHFTRPGAEFTTSSPSVTLAPTDPWLATFYALETETHHAQIYVDMATPSQWSDAVLTSVDLDLDVIRTFAGHVVIDDEDEFEEHQVSLGYPPEIIDLALVSCAEVHHGVLHGQGPFDLSVSDRWLGRLAELG